MVIVILGCSALDKDAGLRSDIGQKTDQGEAGSGSTGAGVNRVPIKKECSRGEG